jgi:hypothetical protein
MSWRWPKWWVSSMIGIRKSSVSFMPLSTLTLMHRSLCGWQMGSDMRSLFEVLPDCLGLSTNWRCRQRLGFTLSVCLSWMRWNLCMLRVSRLIRPKCWTFCHSRTPSTDFSAPFLLLDWRLFRLPSVRAEPYLVLCVEEEVLYVYFIL